MVDWEEPHPSCWILVYSTVMSDHCPLLTARHTLLPSRAAFKVQEVLGQAGGIREKVAEDWAVAADEVVHLT